MLFIHNLIDCLVFIHRVILSRCPRCSVGIHHAHAYPIIHRAVIFPSLPVLSVMFHLNPSPLIIHAVWNTVSRQKALAASKQRCANEHLGLLLWPPALSGTVPPALAGAAGRVTEGRGSPPAPDAELRTALCVVTVCRAPLPPSGHRRTLTVAGGRGESGCPWEPAAPPTVGYAPGQAALTVKRRNGPFIARHST